MHTRTLTALALLCALSPAFAQEVPVPTEILPAEESLRQWAEWEMKANTARWRKTQNYDLRVVEVPLSSVIVDHDPNIRPEILNHFVRGETVLFPHHPHNTDRVVPFMDRPQVAAWEATPTASRSVIHWQPFFTVKMPTNKPHGANGPTQNKANLQKSVIVSRARGEHVAAVDAQIGRMHHGVMLDVMTVRDRQGGNGFVVRDLSEMRARHYYVPGFSIPYVGQQIAQANGAEFVEFWTKHDAEAYGRAKAQMLLRYGLWFETPNAQNRLIELDPNLKPTGRILMRDLSDTLFNESFSRALGFEGRMEADIRERVTTTHPYAQNSYWQMSEAPGVTAQMVETWERAHERAYAAELSRAIGAEVRPDEKRRVLSEAEAESLRAWHRTQGEAARGFGPRQRMGIANTLTGEQRADLERHLPKVYEVFESLRATPDRRASLCGGRRRVMRGVPLSLVYDRVTVLSLA